MTYPRKSLRLLANGPTLQRRHLTWPPRGWKTTTLLNAIRLDGILEEAIMSYDGAMNHPTFEGYVEQCFARSLRPGDIVVMDNLSAHKSPLATEIIEAVDASV